MLRIDQGGLIFYGGFILATLAVIVFARVRGLPLLRVGDFTVSALPLGHAMGRIGCFLNGCCYGAPTDVPWATYVADAMRHPVQLYEASFNFILYAVLHLLLRTARTGQVVAVYLMSYGTWRFLIEFLRGDDRLRTGGLDAAQLISLGLILIGAGLALGLRRTPRTG
jgi:phosphatidylglycerol:prolipoprotein diacylglycerol transferase